MQNKSIHKHTIFIGMINVASQLNDLVYGFTQNGHKCVSAVSKYHTNMITSKTVDYDLSDDWISKLIGKIRFGRIRAFFYKRFPHIKDRVFKKVLKKCDVFVFIWRTFEDDCSDLEILKQLGKKVITIFVGDECRWKYAVEQEFKHYGLDYIGYENGYDEGTNGLEYRLLTLRTAEKHSDLILNSKDGAQLALRPYVHSLNFLRFSDYTLHYPDRIDPVVLHLPSNPSFKGTKHILTIFNKLEKEFPKTTFRHLENLSHEEALLEYTNADILVGQILCPGGGKQEREALASGVTVLSNMDPRYVDAVHQISPIIHVDKHSLETQLRTFITNHDLRFKQSRLGFTHAKTTHDVERFCHDLISYLNCSKSANYTFPSYFRNLFTPEESHISVYNRWNNYVSKCNWYKSHVQNGSRDGLVF